MNQDKPKFKKYLFWFFIVEHVLIISFFVIGALAITTVYATSPFTEVNSRATVFTPDPYDQVLANLSSQALATYIPQRIFSDNEGQYKFTVNEKDINSLLDHVLKNELQKLDMVQDFYIAFVNENKIYFWIKLKQLGEPLIGQYTLSQDSEGKFSFKATAFQLGPVPLPSSYIGFTEQILNDSLNNFVKRVKNDHQISIIEITPADNKLNVTIEFNDSIENLIPSEGLLSILL